MLPLAGWKGRVETYIFCDQTAPDYSLVFDQTGVQSGAVCQFSKSPAHTILPKNDIFGIIERL